MTNNEYDLRLLERHQAVVPMPLQMVAQVISVLFHPLFMVAYAYILLAVFNPFAFGEATTERIFSLTEKPGKGVWFINILLFSCIIPIVGVVLMKALGMIHSLSLPTKDERKIPYVLTGMFYMAMVAQNSQNTSLPPEIKIFALGATIALFIAFFINLFSKISTHTVGVGGFLAMVIIIIARSYGTGYLFIFAILICGLVGTSRLLLGAHSTSDLYGGYFIGFISQFVALNYIFSM